MDLLRKLLDRRDNKTQQNNNSGNPLPPGTEAPDFTLPGTTGEPVQLSEELGRPIVLVFYPADNSPVCSSQLALYNQALPLFNEFDAQLLGISVDDLEAHKTFADNLNLSFPLLADNDPAGEVARAFNVYDEQKENARRALFVLDKDGIIRWSYVSPSSINPGANGILEALETLQEKTKETQ